MQNDESLKWERYILDLVYDGDSEFEVEHADSPDFKLTRDGYAFGVEVTELFKDGSNARLVKLPDYMERLLAGERPVHRDDVEGIDVVTLSISDAEGNVKYENVQAIFSETGTLRDHADMLAGHIEKKNVSFQGYDQSLGHISLLIGDHFSSAESIGKTYSTAEFFTPRLRDALRTSPFREVMLITNILYDNVAWVPLRQLELMESFMVFVHSIYESPEALDLLDDEDVVHLFAEAMEACGTPVVLRHEDGTDFASRGNSSIAYTAERGTIVHEYADFPRNDSGVVARRHIDLPQEVRSFIHDEYQRAREQGAGFKTEYFLKVRDTSWPFETDDGSPDSRVARLTLDDGSPSPEASPKTEVSE